MKHILLSASLIYCCQMPLLSENAEPPKTLDKINAAAQAFVDSGGRLGWEFYYPLLKNDALPTPSNALAIASAKDLFQRFTVAAGYSLKDAREGWSSLQPSELARIEGKLPFDESIAPFVQNGASGVEILNQTFQKAKIPLYVEQGSSIFPLKLLSKKDTFEWKGGKLRDLINAIAASANCNLWYFIPQSALMDAKGQHSLSVSNDFLSGSIEIRGKR